ATPQLNKFGAAISSVGNSLKSLASYTAAGTVLYSTIASLRAGVTEIIRYDQALKNMKAITRATDAQIAEMSDTVLEIATSTKFSAVEVANGMVLLGQSGFTATESMDAMHSVAMLATGTLSSMQTVSDLLTTTIRAFNLESIDAARVSDVMANAVNRSKLTIDKLRIAFNFAGASSAQAGLKVEHTAGTMMLLANNGLRASTIGTGLRQVLRRLIAPNDKFKETLRRAGMALDDLNPRMVGYREAIKNMTLILADADGKTVNMSKAFELFGLRGAQAAAVISKGFLSGDFDDMLDKVYEVGTAEKMAGIQAEGLEVKLKRLGDRWKVLSIGLGENGIKGALGILIDTVSALALVLGGFVKSELGGAITQFVIFTTVAGGLTASLAVLTVAIKAGLVASLIKLTPWLGSAAIGFKGMILGGQKLKALSGALSLVPLAGWLIAVSVAAGGLYAIYNRLATSNQRALEQTEQMAVKNQQVARSLEMYKKALDELHKKVGTDKEANREYTATLKRMIKEHGGLKDELGKSVYEHDKLTDAMDRNAMQRREVELHSYVKAIKILNDEVNRIRLTKMSELLPAPSAGLMFLDEQQIKSLSLEKTNEELAESDMRVAKALEDVKTQTQMFVLSLRDMITAKQHTITSANAFIDVAVKEQGGVKVLADIIKSQLIKAMDALAKKSAELKGEFVKNIGKLPAEFKVLYDRLDVVRKVDFAKMMASTEKEEDAYAKKAIAIGLNEEETQAGKEVIRAKGYLKMITDLNKEVLTEKQSGQAKLLLLDQYIASREEKNTKALENEQRGKEVQLAGAKIMGQSVVGIEERFLKSKKSLEDQHTGFLKAIGIVRKNIKLALYKLELKDYEALVKKKIDADSAVYGHNRATIQRELDWEKNALQKSLDEKNSFIEQYHTDENKITIKKSKALQTYYKDYSNITKKRTDAMIDEVDREHKHTKDLIDKMFGDRTTMEKNLVDMVGVSREQAKAIAADETLAEKARSLAIQELYQSTYDTKKEIMEAMASDVASQIENQNGQLDSLSSRMKSIREQTVKWNEK
ncbi:MAG: phage tail tape measure protein, partial [Desulfobacula sp.]|nr:phage tail tape measure protein [Desulfobacula sp.]